jgi:hypothetical protein
MSQPGWRRLFVAREAEMAWLQTAWREAQKGRPQLRVLVGDRGLGKTRLVQEFYRWLSRAEDPVTPAWPEGYWPDAFTSEAVSLDVNPTFPKNRTGQAPPMPWLWWGLRWVMPEQSNKVTSGCALIDFQANLEPHTRPIFAKRQLWEHRKDALWKFGSVLSLVLPLHPGIAAKELLELATKYRHREKDLKRVSDAGPADTSEAYRRDLETGLLETFRWILDPANTQAPTVPVIFVMDDAQWADPVTLSFVAKMFREARVRHWPLLVIATHWEAEWKVNLRDAPSPGEYPTQLADLPQWLNLGDTWTETGPIGAKLIGRISELSDIMEAALPGLTQAQRKLILDKADGIPGLLEEILQHLIDHPQFFEQRQLTRPLTKRAEQEVLEQTFDYHKFVANRFSRLEDHVRRILSWSSAQGMRFLASITEAIAQHVAPEYFSRVRPALEAAEDPHCLVQLFHDCNEFNLGEFRQAAFYDVARKNLAFDENEAGAVDSALCGFFGSWLRSEPGDAGNAGMKATERRNALEICVRKLSPDKPETRGLWATATAQLADLLASEGLWPQALRLAQQVADRMPQTLSPYSVMTILAAACGQPVTDSISQAWPVQDISSHWQKKTAEILLKMRDLDRAHRMVSSLVSQTVPQAQQP